MNWKSTNEMHAVGSESIKYENSVHQFCKRRGEKNDLIVWTGNKSLSHWNKGKEVKVIKCICGTHLHKINLTL